MSDKIDLTLIIAEAIREADRSWFNEDYTKQAQNVLRAVRSQGLEIVPRSPPDELVEQAIDDMPMGRLTREQVMTEIYKAMLKHARNYVI